MTTVIHTDESVSALPALTERRRHPRHLCNRVCYARPNGTATGMTWGVILWDISLTGFSIILRCQLQPGMVVAIQPFRDSDSSELFGCVVRALRLPDGSWLYGLTFPEPLHPTELNYWLKLTNTDADHQNSRESKDATAN